MLLCVVSYVQKPQFINSMMCILCSASMCCITNHVTQTDFSFVSVRLLVVFARSFFVAIFNGSFAYDVVY